MAKKVNYREGDIILIPLENGKYCVTQLVAKNSEADFQVLLFAFDGLLRSVEEFTSEYLLKNHVFAFYNVMDGFIKDKSNKKSEHDDWVIVANEKIIELPYGLPCFQVRSGGKDMIFDYLKKNKRFVNDLAELNSFARFSSLTPEALLHNLNYYFENMSFEEFSFFNNIELLKKTGSKVVFGK